MKKLRDIADEIVAREGGYVNNPDDPGGAANFGVTIHTMRRLGLDLNSDGKVTSTDIRQLTCKQATNIFVTHYFVEPGIAKLPEVLPASVFDMYVNAGSNAVKVMQRMLVRMGIPITVEGVIGPKTAAAVHLAFQMAPDHLADAYAVARRNYYFALADAHPASRKYARTRAGKRRVDPPCRRIHGGKVSHDSRTI